MFKELTLKIHSSMGLTFADPSTNTPKCEILYTDAIKTPTTTDVYEQLKSNRKVLIKTASDWNFMREYVKDLKIFIFLNAEQIHLFQNANIILYANLEGIDIRLIMNEDIFNQIKNDLLSFPHQNYVYFHSEPTVNKIYPLVTYLLGSNVHSDVNDTGNAEANVTLEFNDDTFQQLWSEKHQTYFDENFVITNLIHHHIATTYYPDGIHERVISFDFDDFERNLQDIIMYAWIDSRQQTVKGEHHIDKDAPKTKSKVKPINNSRLIKQLAYLGQYSSIIHD